MGVSSVVRDQLATRFEVLLPHLNERQQRLALATEARLLGHGGVRAVAEVAGVSVTTVRKGVFELEGGEDPLPPERARRRGGGRKSAATQDPGLVPALLALVEPDERGDPMSPLRWTTKSLRHLAPGVDPARPSGLGTDGGQAAGGAGLQPAGQRQDPGRQAAPGPGCAVPLSQASKSSSTRLPVSR
jgi:hypothetical protein